MRSRLLILPFFTSLLLSQLQVGQKAPEWSFPDGDGKMFAMDEWKGMVLQVNYVDPDESELNEHVNDAIDKAVDVDKIIDRDTYQGIGIADCASSWKPDFAIRMIGAAKAENLKPPFIRL